MCVACCLVFVAFCSLLFWCVLCVGDAGCLSVAGAVCCLLLMSVVCCMVIAM